MYHAIVKRIALQNFLRVNQKDYAPILKGCSPDVHHRFGGHHGDSPRGERDATHALHAGQYAAFDHDELFFGRMVMRRHAAAGPRWIAEPVMLTPEEAAIFMSSWSAGDGYARDVP